MAPLNLFLSRWLDLARREIALLGALCVAAFAAHAFLEIAEEVGEGETRLLDTRILYALRTEGDPAQPIGPHWLRIAAADLTALGSVTDLFIVVLVMAGVFISLRRWRGALVMALASGGGLALSQLLKGLYERERPPVALHAVEVVNASFPSGHAMMSAAVYLTIGALTARFASRRRVKAFAVGAAAALTLLIGASRVYLGVHWPTDVLAGWSLGAAWATACWLVAYLWERGWPQLRAEAGEAEAG